MKERGKRRKGGRGIPGGRRTIEQQTGGGA